MNYFVIPAYNEEANLSTLLRSLARWCSRRGAEAHLVVVDDGSRDATAGIAGSFRELPLTLVRHVSNQGVHQVFRSGFLALRELAPVERDVVITLEADNTSSLAILDQMLRRVEDGVDLVLASCYAPGGAVTGTNWRRRLLSRCANLLLRCVPGMPKVHTFSSFYRAYRAGFFLKMLSAYGDQLIQEAGFVCVVEMLLKCNRLRPRIEEVPLILDGRQRQGPSKMKTLRTIRGYLGLFLRAVTGRLARPSAALDCAPGSVQRATGRSV